MARLASLMGAGLILVVAGGSMEMASAAPVRFAQLATLKPLAPVAPPAPTYGVQPYDPSNPRGFYHPNDMGFGSYQNPTRLYGHRPRGFKDRRYKGY